MISNSFADPQLIAQLTAKMLLEINAVHFRTDEPYKLASGLASPVYIDCRKLISYPRIRSTLMDFATSTLLRDVGFEAFDSVAGGETAGIPFAAWIADRLELPMQYVRKQPKGYGRDAQIEGDLPEGSRILLVEDLTTDGGSKIRFCEAIRKAGGVVNHTIVIFYYDIFAEAQETLTKHNISLHYLATWRDVLRVSKEYGYFDTGTLGEVEKFLDAPLEWSAAHGGVSEVLT
ncbi:MAG: orotate phosphoribosyltransferase [Chromatiales bacterium]|jgi:orotate phosphoribosyltransferase|nr:orotate phosphoribosyltransferase [Chromatiales bacterium]